MEKRSVNEKSLYIFIGLSTAILIIITICMIFSFGAENRAAIAKQSSEDIYEQIIHTSFLEMTNVTRMLSEDESVKRLLSSGGSNESVNVYNMLNTMLKTFDMDLCYVLDRTGVVVESSVYAKDHALVMKGRDYSFRPYFVNALNGLEVIYPALGSTTKERGVYFSSPVLDSASAVIGVVVSKLDMQAFDAVLKKTASPAAVTTSEGIVFSTNQKDWLYKSIRPLPFDITTKIAASKQFLDIPITKLELSLQGDIVQYNNQKFTLIERQIGHTDWVLYTFLPIGSIPFLTPTQWVYLSSLLLFFTILLASIGVVVLSLSKRRTAEEMQRKLFLAVQQSSSVIVITDKNGVVEYVNPAFTQVTGYSLQESVNNDIGFIKSDVHDKSYFDAMWNVISAGNDWRGTICNKRKNGELYWDETLISSVKDHKGRITNYIAIKEDVTKRKELDELLHRYATTDEMTDVLNRRSGMLIMERQILTANRENESFAILFMDINGLKTVNDTLGHNFGDELIVTAVGVLKDTLRESDAICRLGGDEFLIILPSAGTQVADAILQRIWEKAEAINQSNRHLFLLSMSFGLAEYQPGSGQTMDDLIRTADENMYKNKVSMKQQLGTGGVLRYQAVAE